MPQLFKCHYGSMKYCQVNEDSSISTQQLIVLTCIVEILTTNLTRAKSVFQSIACWRWIFDMDLQTRL